MKKIPIAIAIFTVMAMVSGSAFAEGPTLTVGETGKTYKAAPGSTVAVPIMINQLAGVAGFAFTVTHGELEVTEVTSTAIGTFKDLKFDSADGLGTDGKVDTLSSPLVFNTDAAGGSTKIAAAVPNALTGTASAALCTVTFKIPADAAKTDTYDVKIVPTNLKNEAAGYLATGEDIAAIIQDDATYSPLLTAVALKDAAPAGKVSVGGIPGDASGDEVIDGTDALFVLNYAAGNITSEQLANDCDVNGDGAIDGTDALYILNFAAGNITSFDNP
jgi:hypothetical protein